MHGKEQKVASAALTALLFTQGLLGFAAVALVVLKDHVGADAPARPALVASAASSDAQVR